MNFPLKIAIPLLLAVFSLQSLSYASDLFTLDNNTDLVETPDQTKRVELIKNELYVNITKVKIGNQATEYRYLSEGMFYLGHAEIFAVFVNFPNSVDDLSAKVGSYLKMVHNDVRGGKRLQPGDYTQFNPGNYFGWDGIIYTDSPSHLAGEFPRPTLNMLVLSANEVQAVQEFGHLRVLTMLGKESSHYPNPYWSDLGRKELPISAMRSRSLASRIPVSLMWQGASATVNSERLYLRINPNFDVNLPYDMNSGSAVRIMLSLSDDADGCFTFSFDDPRNGLSAIMAPNSRGKKLGCCMLLLAQSENYSGKIIEDGFVLLLTAPQWESFWQAIRGKRGFQIESEKSTSFFLEWW